MNPKNHDDDKRKYHQGIKELFLARHADAEGGQDDANAIQSMQDGACHHDQLTRDKDRAADQCEESCRSLAGRLQAGRE